MTEGEALKHYIDNQGLNKSAIARDLEMSKQNLFQYFKSQYLTPETKRRFEQYFGKEIFSEEILASETVVKKVRQPKIETDPEKEGITFIPISAQAGYPKRMADPIFESQLEKLYIPGMPYRGEKFRVWEVEGNSMEPTFKEHFHILTEKVDREAWHQVKHFYAYVIVTEEDVLLKRIGISKSLKDQWVLISDNYELYPQFPIPIEIVKEVWLVKRKMDWEMSPPKRFDIEL